MKEEIEELKNAMDMFCERWKIQHFKAESTRDFWIESDIGYVGECEIEIRL